MPQDNTTLPFFTEPQDNALGMFKPTAQVNPANIISGKQNLLNTLVPPSVSETKQANLANKQVSKQQTQAITAEKKKASLDPKGYIQRHAENELKVVADNSDNYIDFVNKTGMPDETAAPFWNEYVNKGKEYEEFRLAQTGSDLEDASLSIGKGLVSTASVIPAVAALTGNESARDLLVNLNEIRSKLATEQSPALQQQYENVSEQVDRTYVKNQAEAIQRGDIDELGTQAVGFFSEAWEAVKATSDNPAVLLDTAIEQVPQLLTGGILGKTVSTAAKKSILSKKGLEEGAAFLKTPAGKKALEKAGTIAGVSTAGLQEGASVTAEALAAVRNMSIEDLKNNSPLAQELLASNPEISDEDLRNKIEDSIAVNTMVWATTVAMGISKVSGAGKASGNLLNNKVIKPISTGAKEGLEEFVQGTATQGTANVVTQKVADATKEVREGLGLEAGLGALAGGTAGAAISGTPLLISSTAKGTAAAATKLKAAVEDITLDTTEARAVDAAVASGDIEEITDKESSTYKPELAITALAKSIPEEVTLVEAEEFKNQAKSHYMVLREEVAQAEAEYNAKAAAGTATQEDLDTVDAAVVRSQKAYDLVRNLSSALKTKDTGSVSESIVALKTAYAKPEDAQEHVVRVMGSMASDMDSVSVAQAEELLQSPNLDAKQKNKVKSFIALRKSTDKVTSDVITGSADGKFLGISDYREMINASSAVGDQDAATSAYTGLSNFTARHNQKAKDARYVLEAPNKKERDLRNVAFGKKYKQGDKISAAFVGSKSYVETIEKEAAALNAALVDAEVVLNNSESGNITVPDDIEVEQTEDLVIPVKEGEGTTTTVVPEPYVTTDDAREEYVPVSVADLDIDSLPTTKPTESVDVTDTQEVEEDVEVPSTTNLRVEAGGVYDANPALQAIGTREAYINYVANIFPDSQVKGVVFHGSGRSFEEFDTEFLGETTGKGEYVDKGIKLDSEYAIFFSDSEENTTQYSMLERQEKLRQVIGLLDIISSAFYFNPNPLSGAIKPTNTLASIDLEVANNVKKILQDTNLNNKAKRKSLNELNLKYQKLSETTQSTFTIMLANYLRTAKGLRAVESNIKKDGTYSSKDIVSIYDKASPYNVVEILEDGSIVGRHPHNGKNIAALSKEERKVFIQEGMDKLNVLKREAESAIKEGGYTPYTYVSVINLRNPAVKDFEGETFVTNVGQKTDTVLEAAEMTAKAVAEGKDGVVFENLKDPELATNYGVFDAEDTHILGTPKDITNFARTLKDVEVTPEVEEVADSRLPVVKENLLSRLEKIQRADNVKDKDIDGKVADDIIKAMSEQTNTKELSDAALGKLAKELLAGYTQAAYKLPSKDTDSDNVKLGREIGLKADAYASYDLATNVLTDTSNDNLLSTMVTTSKGKKTSKLQNEPNYFANQEESYLKSFNDLFTSTLGTIFKRTPEEYRVNKTGKVIDKLNLFIKAASDNTTFPNKTAEILNTFDPNMISAMALEGLNWLSTDAGKSLFNDENGVNSLLGLTQGTKLPSSVKNEFLTKGIPVRKIAEGIGKNVLKNVGLKLDSNVTEDIEATLPTAIGNMVISVLVKQGHVNYESIPRKSIDDALSQINPEHEANPNNKASVVTVRIANNVVEGRVGIASKTKAVIDKGRENKEELDSVFGIKSYSVFPSLKEPTTAPSFMKGTFMRVSKRIQNAIIKHQKRPQGVKQNMHTIFSALDEDIVKTLLGYSDPKESHISERDSISAVNNDIEYSLANYKEFISDVLKGNVTKEFFYRHEVWKNGRLGLVGNMINPQTNKFIRHMVGSKRHEVTIDPTNKKEFTQFLLAAAETLGIKVDKLDPNSSIDELRGWLADKDFKAFLKELGLVIKGAEASPEFQESLVHWVGKGGEKFMSLDGMVALSQMGDGKAPFKTDIFREIDGITNGVAIGVLQTAKSSAESFGLNPIIKTLEQAGIFLKGQYSKYSDFLSKKNKAGKPLNQDAYQELALSVYNASLGKVSQAAGNLVGELVKDGVIQKLGRDLFKDPVMTTNYGSGIGKVVENFGYSILGNTYKALTKAYKANDKSTFEALLNDVHSLIGTRSNITFDNFMETALTKQQEAKFIENLGAEYAPLIKEGIEGMFGGFISARTEMNNALNLAFNMFKVEFDKRIEEVTKEEGGVPNKAKQLKITESMMEVLPIFKHAMSDGLEDSLLIMNQGRDAAQAGNPDYSNRQSYSEKVGKDKSKKITGLAHAWLDGGVSGVIMGIHSLDAATMIGLLDKYDVLNVHDAAAFSLKEVGEGTTHFNKVFFEQMRDYNLREQIGITLDRAVENFSKTATQEDLVKLNKLVSESKGVRETIPEIVPYITEFQARYNINTGQQIKLRNEIFNMPNAVWSQYNDNQHTYVPEVSEPASTEEVETIKELTDAVLQEPIERSSANPNVTDWLDNKAKFNKNGNLDGRSKNSKFYKENQTEIDAVLDSRDAATEVSTPKEEPIVYAAQESVYAPVVEAIKTNNVRGLITALINKPNMNPSYVLILKGLQKYIPDNINLVYVDSVDDPNYLNTSSNGRVSAGIYNPNMDSEGNVTITYNDALTDNTRTLAGTLDETVIHELLHAVFYGVIRKPTTMLQKQARTRLTNLMSLARKAAKGTESAFLKYGLNDVQEFIVMGLTNPEFQQFLLDTKLPNKKSETVWSTFVATVAKVFGVTSEVTAMHELLSLSEDLVRSDTDIKGSAANVDTDPSNFTADTTNEGLTGTSVLDTFTRLGSNFGFKPTEEHSNQLLSLLGSLSSKFIEPFNLQMRKLGGVNYGFTDINGQDIFINYTDKAGSIFNDKSAQEIYAHEFVHRATATALDAYTLTSKEVKKLYDVVASVASIEDFLPEGVNELSPEYNDALKQATAMYDYMFNNTSGQVTKKTDPVTGAVTTTTRNNYLHEFVAHGVTNPLTIKLLKSSKVTEALKKSKDVSLFEGVNSPLDMFKLVSNVFHKVLNALSEQVTHIRTIKSADGRLMALVNNMAAHDHRTKASELRSRDIQGRIDSAAVSALSKFVTDPLTNFVKRNEQAPAASIKGVLSTVGGYIVTDHAELGEVIKDILRRLGLSKDNIVSSLITEIAGRTKNSGKWHDLLTYSKKVIDQLRADTTSKLTAYITESYSQALTTEESKSVTKIMKTDLSALVDKYGISDAIKFVGSKDALTQEITSLRNLLLNTYGKQGQAYIKLANSLGSHMATGKGTEAYTLLNAHNIANLYLPKGSPIVPQGDLLAAEQTIDLLASLEAIRYTGDKYKTDFMAIYERELADNKTSNGISVTLGIAKTIKEESFAKNFSGNKVMVEKGYMKDTTNPHIDVLYAPAEDEVRLASQGYEKMGEVATDPHTTGDKLYMYKSNAGLLNQYLSSISSLTSKKSRGTDIMSMHVEQGTPNATAIAYAQINSINNTKANAVRGLFSSKDTTTKANSLVPVLDLNGAVVNYRYMMQDTTKDDVLQRNNDIAHIFASTTASIEDKVNTEDVNDKVVQLAYDQYKEDKSRNKSERYVAIGLKVSNPKYREIYQMMPQEMRNEIKRVWGDNTMYVQESLVDLIFGYRKWSLTNRYNKDDVKDMQAKGKYLNSFGKFYSEKLQVKLIHGENIWQEVVKVVKDTIVIKIMSTLMNNVISNWTSLTMLGVSQVDIAKSHSESIRAAKDYQKETAKLFQLETDLKVRVLSPTAARRVNAEIARIKNDLANNPVKDLIDAGIYQSIIDDVAMLDDGYTYKDGLESKLEPLTSKFPQWSKDMGNQIVMGHDTDAYKFFRDSTQLSDFVARYTLHKHNLSKGMDSKESIDMIKEIFVVYDIPTNKYVQWANDMGLLMFTKFLFRTIKVVFYMMKNKPASVLGVQMLQSVFQDISDIYDSALLIGSGLNFNLNPLTILKSLFQIPAIDLVT